MDYFHSHPLPADAGIVAAWDSQLASADQLPSLRDLLAERGAELFPEFAKRYAAIRALPRSARRSLQRRLAQSRELTGLPSEWRRRLAYSLAGAALLLALSQAPAADAGIITVNAKSPEIRIDGLCSLKEAIHAANSDSSYDGCAAGSGPDTIMLPGGAQSVTSSSDIVFGSYTGLPLITTEITITGNNSKIARKSSTFFRLFAVDTGGDLTLSGVTLSGGVASGDGTTAGNADGGAILNKGSLAIQNSTITGNLADRGGAIFNDGAVEIERSVFSKNTAGLGGAIYNRTGELDITDNSVITGNKADYGGAIWSTFGATTTIDNSTVSKNSASRLGGAVFNANGYVIILDGSLLTGNKAAQEGGGVFSSSGLTHIYDSTVSKNSTGERGGGLFISNSGTLVMTNSDISGNKAGTSGGGLYRAGNAYIGYGNTFSKNKAPIYADHFP